MCFFCDFYISMLNFVLYRLYTDAGLHYPPKIDAVLAGQDEGMPQARSVMCSYAFTRN